MKKFLVAASMLFASSSFAQNCLGYYLFQNNKTVEVSMFNKKGKPGGKKVYTISGLSVTGNVTTANIKTDIYDDKEKIIGSGSNDVKCIGGVVMMNMKMMMPEQQQKTIQTADVNAENFYIEYPPTMSAGDALKDGNFSMDIDMNGMQHHLTMVVNNRKVEGTEKITTAAGSWDCLKISYKAKITIKTMGIGIPINTTGIDWFAPNFGIVKSESSYGTSEITSIK